MHIVLHWNKNHILLDNVNDEHHTRSCRMEKFTTWRKDYWVTNPRVNRPATVLTLMSKSTLGCIMKSPSLIGCNQTNKTQASIRSHHHNIEAVPISMDIFLKIRKFVFVILPHESVAQTFLHNFGHESNCSLCHSHYWEGLADENICQWSSGQFSLSSLGPISWLSPQMLPAQL